MLGPAGEGPRCLPKVSAWRHGASSEGHAAASASCLSLCDGSIERWPVTMSKPPRGPPHPGHTHLPRVLGAGAPDVQPASERGEGALQWARLARIPASAGREARPQHHLAIRLCSTPLVLAASVLAQPRGDTCPGSWPQGCSVRGLSPVRDCSHLVTGSPSLPDKYRHAREMMLLLPAHRDRPSSAMYPAAILENGQVARAAHQLSPAASLLA